MDVMQARVALRERGLLDVLDLMVRFAFAHKVPFAKVALAVLVPSYALTFLVAEWAGWAWAWIFAVFFASWAQTPFVSLASRLVFADKVRVGEVLKAGLRAMPRVFGARIVYWLGIGVALMLVMFPAVYLGTLWLFLPEIITLEGASVGLSLGRSQRLASTSLGEVLLATMFLAVLPVLSVILFDVGGRELLREVLEITPPTALFKAGGGWLPLLGFWLFLPFGTLARFFLYLNVRTRAEGWDIQTRFAAIAARGAA
jgi:hypothetical protein